MKIREIRLQNGIFVYKVGISFTKWDFHLQRETLGLQTGLSLYISPICIDSAISGKADVNERVELLYKITFKNDSQI